MNYKKLFCISSRGDHFAEGDSIFGPETISSLKMNLFNELRGLYTARRDESVRLDPVIYEAWLGENPKVVEGGPLELMPCPYCSDEDAVNLDAHRVSSEILPGHYADKLHISGYYGEYEGFKIYVKPDGFDYLLMAHQSHSGPFRAADGRKLDDHPHFHELDFFHRINGAPGTRRPVPPSLRAGMNSAELLEAFLNHYYFSDGRENAIEMPSKRAVQKGLEEFYE